MTVEPPREWLNERWPLVREQGATVPEYKQGDIVLAWVRDPEWKVAINYEDIKVRLGFTPPDLWHQIVAEILHQQAVKKRKVDEE
jgi:hypothetical protein